MWEAIAANRRRSRLLIGLLGAVLVLLGAVIGLAVAVPLNRPATLGRWLGTQQQFVPPARLQRYESDPADDLPASGARPLLDEIIAAQNGAYWGMGIALLIWLVLWVTAVAGGDSILLGAAKAVEVPREAAPQLWNVVEEMTIASGLKQMPKIYVIDDSSLNAFAVGNRPERAAVAVTAGLLKRLSRDELQGVIGHELGHIHNLDIRFMTLASVMVGAIVLLSDLFLRSVFYSGAGRRSSSRRGGGQAQIIMLVVAILVAVSAPLAAQLLYFACSRRREYLADASAARFTRYPEGLAAALERIATQAAPQAGASKVVAPLYIVNPLQEGALFTLFSTHPPTKERVRILRGMAGAGFGAYEAAFRQVRGAAQSCIGAKTLQDSTGIDLRAASPEVQPPEDPIARARGVGELLEHVLPFVVIPCPCGVRMKVPPQFRKPAVKCPRCGREHEVPGVSAPGAGAGPQAGAPRRVSYQRRGTDWESFRCTCGHPVQISPKFSAPQVACPKCGQGIDVRPAG
jgi:heat shock protein HtpX